MEELENEISTQEEENTVSLASAQALADALTKIEAYTPTTWVDNSSPDIDAEHLNKPEQAIKRVTDALNSAVDVIKDLQSQVTKNSGAISDVNNNLSNISNRLTALTDIILTPANSYSFNADYTYGYKRAGWVEIQFSLVSAFDLNKDRILSIPNGCLPKKQVWFPVYESSGGNVIARGNIVGSNIYINGSNSINGKTKLFGHVVYMSES